MREDPETEREGGAREVTARRKLVPGQREVGGGKTGETHMKGEEAITPKRRGVLRVQRKGEKGLEVATISTRERRGGMAGPTGERKMLESQVITARQTLGGSTSGDTAVTRNRNMNAGGRPAWTEVTEGKEGSDVLSSEGHNSLYMEVRNPIMVGCKLLDH